MQPILFHIGAIPVRSYGLMMAVAFAVGIWIARRRALKQGLDPDVIIDLSFFIILAAILGSRLTYVIIHWPHFQGDPLSVLRIWDGGLTQYGGFVFGIVVGILFFIKRRIDPWLGADLVTPSLAMGVALGRVGCFLNGCCYGRPCDLPWAVSFPPDSAAGSVYGWTAVHPTQLYAVIAALAIFVIVLVIEPRKPFHGFLLWLFVLLMSIYRFLIDAVRHYEQVSIVYSGENFTFTSNQLLGSILILVSIGFLVYLSRKDRARRASVPAKATP